ncbi:beta-1,3-glucanase family protein [Glycomyces halotolerans]
MLSRRKLITATAATGIVAASAPWWSRFAAPRASATPATCELALANHTDTASVNAYVTGREFGTDRMMLVRAGQGPYYLEEPPAPGTPLPIDASIPLNAPGADPVVLTLPRMYGSRVYFVREDTLDFYVNPGPALVEPALHNENDANFGKIVSFCEFTFNDVQLFINLSYVDLVTALPIGIRLQGAGDHGVAPLPAGAVEAIASDLEAQAAADGQPWDELVMRGDGGRILRVMSPQNIMAPRAGQPDMPFNGYWSGYADQVWEHYRHNDLRVDNQGGRGVFTGRVQGDHLVFNDGSSFAKPNDWDIFTCDHGPFTNNPGDSDVRKGILARLAAAFNRSTILSHADQPNGAAVDEFYRHPITNHYSRVVHANSPIGYAFPYDDVTPNGAHDQSGAAADPEPGRLTLTVGGGGGGGSMTGAITGFAGKCMDVEGGVSADGTPVQLYTPNGTAAQQWTFHDDGTIRALGKCLDVAGGSTENGAKVQLWTPNGTAAQQWVLTDQHELVNPQSGKCIDVAGWNSADGTDLIMWERHGGENQKWYRS